MSWSLQNPCWNCKKNEFCKDAKNIQDGIYVIHQDAEGHKGSGMVVMCCSNCETKTSYK